MGDWLIQLNPEVWRVFDWWETTDETFDDCTLSWDAPLLKARDRFALWIAGKESGIYATGRVLSSAYPVPPPSGGFWRKPPPGPVYGADLDTELYLFDRPIRKHELKADPGFSRALILRMPGYRNPFPLEPDEWAAIARRLPRGAARTRAATRPSTSAGSVVVTERPVGSVVESTTVTPPSVERVRTYREAQLVKAFEKSLGSCLVVLTATLPTGERLVADAYDVKARRLIEAKASASRQDIRMAIGQLMDYRRHIDPGATLVILLPERPSPDLLDLLRSLAVDTIVREGSTFRTL